MADGLRRIGIPCSRLDAEDTGSTRVRIRLDETAIEIGEHRFRCSVAWIRHFSMRAAHSRSATADRMLSRDSWQAFVDEMPALATTVVGARRLGRVRQLRDAAAAGVRVPRTALLCSAAAPAWPDVDKFVVKVLDRHYIEAAPGGFTWYFPRVVGREEIGKHVGGQFPRLIQEFVPHDHEVRVYAVAGELCAFRVDKSLPEDIWTRPGQVEVRAVAAPPAARAAVRMLARRWRLVYGAFDFLMCGDEATFLEVNEHGDWRWFERKAETSAVGDAVVRAIRDLHTAHVIRAGGRPARPQLLTFLGAGC